MTLSRLASVVRAIAIAIAVAATARATLWVSPEGDDRNPGTEEQPVRTLERARDLVRALNRDMADDITVFVAGELHVERPIEFGPEDSGTNGFNIVYTAAPGEHPILDGAVRITGWTLADKARNLWSAPSPPGVASTHTLFVNGSPVCRTRSRLLAVFTRDADAAPALAPDPKAQWKNPDDVAFEPPDAGAIWSERSAPSPTYVENAFELLGNPGEWYFDRPAHRFYYTPRVGEDMPTAEVEAAVAPALITGRGSIERPIAGLVFKGIRFEFTAGPDAAHGEPAGLVPGAVSFTNAAGIQFLEDDFLHMGTPALDLGPGLDSGTVEGCIFADISWSAVRIEGASRVRIAESRLSYTAVDQVREGAIDVESSSEVAVEHDQLDHFPSVAVAVRNAKPDAVRRSSNWVTPPMISLKGFVARGPNPIPAQEIGISQDYRALEDQQFSANTAPRPPTNVSAEGEDDFAYVTWMPNCRDGGLPVERYVVEASTGAKATVTAAEFQQKGYIVMDGLGNGHPVTFTVSAASAAGASPPSLPTASVTPRQRRKLRIPAAPASVSVTAGTAGTTLQITPPTADGGSPVVSYLVTAGAASEPVVIEGLDVIHSDAAHPISRSLPALRLAHGASLSIIAVNTAGEGKPAVVVVK